MLVPVTMARRSGPRRTHGDLDAARQSREGHAREAGVEGRQGGGRAAAGPGRRRRRSGTAGPADRARAPERPSSRASRNLLNVRPEGVAGGEARHGEGRGPRGLLIAPLIASASNHTSKVQEIWNVAARVRSPSRSCPGLVWPPAGAYTVVVVRPALTGRGARVKGVGTDMVDVCRLATSLRRRTGFAAWSSSDERATVIRSEPPIPTTPPASPPRRRSSRRWGSGSWAGWRSATSRSSATRTARLALAWARRLPRRSPGPVAGLHRSRASRTTAAWRSPSWWCHEGLRRSGLARCCSPGAPSCSSSPGGGALLRRAAAGAPGRRDPGLRARRCRRVVRGPGCSSTTTCADTGLPGTTRTRSGWAAGRAVRADRQPPDAGGRDRLLAAMPDAMIMVKRSMFRNPLVGPVLRCCRHIAGPRWPILRRGGLRAGASHASGRAPGPHLPRGDAIAGAGPGGFRLGAFASRPGAGVPVVPVLVRCEPPTLMRGQPWYEIPERTAGAHGPQLPAVGPGTTARCAGPRRELGNLRTARLAWKQVANPRAGLAAGDRLREPERTTMEDLERDIKKLIIESLTSRGHASRASTRRAAVRRGAGPGLDRRPGDGHGDAASATGCRTTADDARNRKVFSSVRSLAAFVAGNRRARQGEPWTGRQILDKVTAVMADLFDLDRSQAHARGPFEDLEPDQPRRAGPGRELQSMTGRKVDEGACGRADGRRHRDARPGAPGAGSDHGLRVTACGYCSSRLTGCGSRTRSIPSDSITWPGRIAPAHQVPDPRSLPARGGRGGNGAGSCDPGARARARWAISLRNMDNARRRRPCTPSSRHRGGCWRSCARPRGAAGARGGAGYTIFPAELLEVLAADWGVVGEGERARALFDALEARTEPTGLPGVPGRRPARSAAGSARAGPARRAGAGDRESVAGLLPGSRRHARDPDAARLPAAVRVLHLPAHRGAHAPALRARGRAGRRRACWRRRVRGSWW